MTSRQVSGASTLAPIPPLSFIQASIGLSLASLVLPQAASAQAVELEDVQIRDNALNPQNLSSPKYTQPLRDVPQSISVVPKELIQRQNAQTLEDVLRNVPGITFNSGEGNGGIGDSINIRGFNSGAYGGSNVYRDGVRESAFYTRSEMFNTEQVEVVKGSSSATWGAGVIGGGINLVSKSAYLGDLNSVSVGVGTAEYKRLTLDSNHVLNSDLGIAARLNLVGTETGVNGRDWIARNRWGIAPSIAFGLNTATRLHLGYEHLDDRGNYDYGIPAEQSSGKAKKYPGVRWDGYWGFRNLDHENNRSDRFRFKVEHDFNDALTLTNQLTYDQVKRDYVVTTPSGAFLQPGTAGNPPQPRPISGRRLIGVARQTENQTLSNQTHLLWKVQTFGIAHSLVAGMEYSQEKLNLKGGGLINGNQGNGGMQPYPGGVGMPGPVDPAHPPSRFVGDKSIGYTSDNDYEGQTRAIYLIDTLKFNQHWQADFSIRRDWWSAENKKLRSRDNVSSPWGTPANAYYGEIKEKLFSYRTAVIYKPVQQASLYAAFGNAKQPSSIGIARQFGITAADETLSPTKGKTYEVGGKWDLFEEALGLSAALFRTEMDAPSNQGGTPAIPEIVRMKQCVEGLELSATGQILPNWSIFAGYSYQKSKIVTDDRQAAVASSEGIAMTNTPKHSASLWNSLQLGQFSLDYGVRYVGERYVGPGQGGTLTKANRVEVQGYWVHDAAVSWQANKAVGVRLNMVNLFNQHYWRQYNGRGFGVPGEGRGAQLTLDYSF
ncbi:hypothetical protein AXE65_09315 [Ventosimonas gracilis]|uniref:TonB-dependent receptor n=1 Tax=Ventosimonas gracilis TaxID=1680762 RepID=A0A139SXE7_9GAMM|nr:TonB-dependent siderophore receptor [Ventosimonas gracilis]KXU39265.1 hypothetical protein AXE65_09315 [Ventosimonas gracilis]